MAGTTVTSIRRRDGTAYYEGPAVPIGDALRAGAVLGSVVSDADLSGMDLRGVEVDGLAFDRCDLSGARLDRPAASRDAGALTAFTGCDMRGIDLRGACLGGHLLRDCDLRGANLAHVEGRLACLFNCDLSGVDATGIVAPQALFENCRIGEHAGNPARFAGADLRLADLRGSRIDAAAFEGADMRGTDLSRVRASDTNFRGARMQGAAFTGARIRRCDLTGADLRHGAQGALRRSEARTDRTIGLEASDNTYGWEVPAAVRKRVGMEARAALGGATGWEGAGDALRRVRAAFGEDRLDRTVAAFRRDRMANLLSGWASIAIGAGASGVLASQLATYVAGFQGSGVTVAAVVGAAALFSDKARDLAKAAVGAGALVLKRHAAPLVEQAVRRGLNLSDLLVVSFRGDGERGPLSRAMAVGGAASVLAGDVRIAVCDHGGLAKAMAWMQAAVTRPGSLPGDVILLRGAAADAGPLALRFHAAGGMSAVYPDAPDGSPVTRRWEAAAVRATSVFLPDHRDADPVRESCSAAREAFYRGVLEDAFGRLPDGRSVRDVLVHQDVRGGLSARYGHLGPRIATSDEDVDLSEDGVHFGMA